jgi:hypothetical protein
MPDEQRGKFMQDAFASVDVSTLRALASAPAFLSGIPEPMHTAAKETVQRLFAPDHFANSRVLAEGEQFATMLHAQLSKSVADSVDFASADELAKNAS